MESRIIREKFLKYFEDKGHTRVKSSSLIPQGDPTLLFANAGMNQFKDCFLGKEKRGYTRATSSQKCVRAGGKHNDLENVGYTARHHTFFEMLGNFSFGDYFKKEAIAFGWEFLTKIMGIDKKYLWVTIYKDDDEAFKYWIEQGVDKSRIQRLGDIEHGDEENFWSMGDTGPCGPCSEIHFDQGKSVGCGKPDCSPACDCDRYLELWNLVFMQYNRTADGKMEPLPAPSIDTGLGLERLAAVMQGKDNNFDTDLILPIIKKMSGLTGVEYGREIENDVSLRVVADHIRAAGFLITDGVLPSNEGRGYVLRRIMRRGIRHSKLLGMDKPVLYKLIPTLIKIMGEVYPELIEKKDYVTKVIKIEEEKFLDTLNEGLLLLDKEIGNIKGNILQGKTVFKLYDTYGFPVDLTEIILKDKGLKADIEGFNAEMEKSREKSKGSFKGNAGISAMEWEEKTDATIFKGYDTYSEETDIILTLDKDKQEVLSLEDEGWVVLKETPFYAESGGQVADTGFLKIADKKILVDDVIKTEKGIFLHHIKPEKVMLKKGDRVLAEIDIDRRKRIMSHHSATHLLQAALRKIAGEHISQAGSYVAPDGFRFDFNHYTSLSETEIENVITRVNKWIIEDTEINWDIYDREEALNSGAMAFFEEKYGDKVRVVKVDEGRISKELCGGTHCSRTGQIGLFWILKETGIAAGVRRIEAVCGLSALKHFKEREKMILDISKALNANVEHIIDKAEKISLRVKELEKETSNLKKEIVKLKTKKSDSGFKAEEINGIKVILEKVIGIEPKELRNMAEELLKSINGSGIVSLISNLSDRCAVSIFISKDLTEIIDARDMVKEIGGLINGGGGGRPDFAQAGGKSADRLDEAKNTLKEYISSRSRK